MYDLSKKFIFTHPPKCGGTSIEDLFGFLQLREKCPSVNTFKHASLKTHLTHLTNKGLEAESFLKFSIIRNPWDRAVSFYHHNKYKEYNYFTNEAINKEMPENVKDSRQMTFKEFVLKYYKNDFNSEVATKPYMCLQDKFSLDYVIRLENLKEDLLRIKDLLQIDLNCDIPHKNNADQFLTRMPYTEYYDSETKNIIGKLFEWDIETFEYKF
jgi:chondroitin 4-sulfotransferase 11